MRYKGRTALAALVAVFVLGAVASASAFAAPPEFKLDTAGESFPTTIGNSLQKGYAGFNSTDLSGSCEQNKLTGEITGVKAVSLTLEWVGCARGGTSIENEGASENGHIVISGSGTLVFIDKAKNEVGILLPLKEVKLIAGTLKFSIRGSIVVPISPINTATHTFNLPIHEKSVGRQEVSSYENEKGEIENTSLAVVLAEKEESASIEVSGADQVTTGKLLTISTAFAAPPKWLSSFGSAGIEGEKFSNPEEAAVAPNGNVYVADTGNNRVQEFTSAGKFVEAFGWGVSNGKAEFQNCTSASKCEAGIAGSGAGQFNSPDGIAVNAAGTIVYVADGANERVQKFSSEGKYLGKFGGEGSGEGQFGHKSAWGWEGPRSVAVAANGHVYVTDSNSVQEFSSGGEEYLKRSLLEGAAPHGVAVSASGDVYVAEEGTSHVQEFAATLGTPIATWGSEGTGNLQFRCPHGLAAGPGGEVFVADECNDRIQELSSSGEYITQWGTPGTGKEEFSSPSGVAVASNGNVYVVDKDNDRVQKFE